MARLTFAQAKQLLFTTVVPASATSSHPTVAQALNFVINKFLKDPSHPRGSQFQVTLPISITSLLAVPTNLVETIDAIQARSSPLDAQYIDLKDYTYLFQQDAPPNPTLESGPFPHTAVRLPNTAATQYDPPVADYVTLESPTSQAGTIIYKDINGLSTSEAFVSTPYTTLAKVQTVTSIQKAAVYPLTIKTLSTDLTIGYISAQDTNPEFARYKVLGTIPDTRTFDCLCTRAAQILSDDNDLVIPSNLNALRYGMMAYNYEIKNDLERANVFWGYAKTELDKEIELHLQNTNPQVHVQLKGFAPKIKNLL